MKYFFISFLLLIGVFSLHAQDKLVLRNGRTLEVKIHRITDNEVHYVYPGETSVYLQPKSAVSYILYSDGRRESFDPNQRSSSGATNRSTPSVTQQQPSRNLNDDNLWQDINTTFAEADVRGMTRLNRISAVSNISYRDAIQKLKKKAAEIGATTILLMDIPENNNIEVMGIAYRDQRTASVPRATNERSNIPPDRRRTTAQNNESNLEYNDYSRNNRNAQPQRSSTAAQPRQSRNPNEPDAVYLIDGNVIRGTIEELDMNDFVSIRTSNGRILEYSMDDVKQVAWNSARNNRGASASSKPSNTSPARSNSRYYDDGYGASNRNRYNDDYYDNYSVSGYKGIVDLGYNIPFGGAAEKGTFEVNTSHGYQINPYLFAGAGLGLHIYNARDSAMKNPRTYPCYMVNYKRDSTAYLRAVDSSFMTLPIFLDIRAYLPIQNSKISPFVMFRVGYSFNLSDGFKGMGIYMNPAIGAKFQIAPTIGLNFSLGYSFQSYGGIPKNGGYGYYYYKDNSGTKYEAKGAGGLSLKLGVEF